MTHVLELFSGIGGMRVGLLNVFSELSFTAVDMNPFCNSVYQQSFGDTPLSVDISSLPVEWFEKLNARIWTMSPPCQPYTRQRESPSESSDPRASALHHLINVLKDLKNIPSYILLENVKNFELSDSFAHLRDVLEERGYELSGYLINPLYLGHPNSRLRFYLVAKLSDSSNLPRQKFKIYSNDWVQCREYEANGLPSWLTETCPSNSLETLLCDCHSYDAALKVPLSVLSKKSSFCFDVVSASSLQTSCFTRAYTKFVNGTGSVLYSPNEAKAPASVDSQLRPVFAGLQSMVELHGSLRYFCPMEVARINGFHPHAKHDKKPRLIITSKCSPNKQMYKALGNSLNPRIIELIVRNTFDSSSV